MHALAPNNPVPSAETSKAGHTGATAAEADERVLIMAPVGQDATAMAALLQREGFKTEGCHGLVECARQIAAGAGALLLTEESLEQEQMPELLHALAWQSAWSELPVIVLTNGGESRLHRLLNLMADAAGAVTLLERPLGAATLLRSVQVALKSRRRQYQVRDLIEEQQRSHLQLRESEERVRSILESITDGFHVIDAEGRFTQFNDEARRMFAEQGVNVEDLLGRRMFQEALPEAAQSDAGPDLQRAMREHVATSRESYYAPWQRWLSIRNFPTPEGGVATFFQDITERKQAEEALRKSEDRYHTLFESMDEAFCLIELLFDENDKAVDYRFVDINPAFEKQTGLKDAKDKTMRELAPDIESHWFEIYGRISQTGVPERFVSSSIVLNRIYEVYAFPMQTSGVHRVGIVFNDISERKQAEEVLRASEERYRTLMESSPDCIKMMDGEGRLEMMNAKGMCLMEIDDFTPFFNKSWWLLWGDDNMETVKLAVQKAVGGESAHFQAFCPTAKGTPKWWDVVVAPVEGGRGGLKPERLISVSRDITSSKQAEQALRASEARFRAIVSHAITGVVEADAAGRMTFVNQRWCEMTGYTEAELLTMNGTDITLPEDLVPTRDSVNLLINGQTSFRLEKRYRRKDGSIFWADSNVNSIRGADGEFLGMVAVVLDVSERRIAEASLRLAKEQAETASRAKDNFLAALSHELRTPLNPVLMAASSLREDESLPPHVREQLAMIERNVALEARLIDDLLDLTRIVRGKLTLHAEPCDMNSLIGLVVEIVRDEAFEKRILIEVDLAAEHSSLMGDPARLQQVFWNLLRNAVKFTPPGGLVRIRSQNVGTGADEHVCISVKDNGIGLDAAAMERIFEPFEQASSSQEHRFGGLGLGLAIARAVVDLHHGSIRAESEGRGQGSTFTVDLPGATTGLLPPPPAPQIAPGAGDGALPQKEASMRLLVVEDHEPTMQVLTRLLRREGHQVMGASRIADAREMAAQNTFDAVISDLGLPDGTGIELMEELRERYGLRGIMLSGYGMEEDMRRSREAGFIAHLVKPIDVNELRRGLRQLAGV